MDWTQIIIGGLSMLALVAAIWGLSGYVSRRAEATQAVQARQKREIEHDHLAVDIFHNQMQGVVKGYEGVISHDQRSSDRDAARITYITNLLEQETKRHAAQLAYEARIHVEEVARLNLIILGLRNENTALTDSLHGET